MPEEIVCRHGIPVRLDCGDCGDFDLERIRGQRDFFKAEAERLAAKVEQLRARLRNQRAYLEHLTEGEGH